MTRAAELLERLDALYADASKVTSVMQHGDELREDSRLHKWEVAIFRTWPAIRALLAAAPPREPTPDMMHAALSKVESPWLSSKLDVYFLARLITDSYVAMYDAALGAGAKGTDGPFLASDCNSDTASDSRTYRIGADPSQARRAEIAAHPHNAGEQHWPLPNGFPRNQSAVGDLKREESERPSGATVIANSGEGDHGNAAESQTPPLRSYEERQDSPVGQSHPAADPSALVAEIEPLQRRLAAWPSAELEEVSYHDAVSFMRYVADVLQRARDALVEQAQEIAALDLEHEHIAALEAALAEASRDAERYRWLRGHFRFANDSVFELWFDATLTLPALADTDALDSTIDAARGAEHG